MRLTKQEVEEKIEQFLPSDELQKKIAYLRWRKVPIEDLIILLETTYKQFWARQDKAKVPLKQDILKWLRSELGCSPGIAQTIQELTRPEKYQRRKKIEEGGEKKKAKLKISVAAKNATKLKQRYTP